MRIQVVMIAGAIASAEPTLASERFPIAGLTPYQRPAGAPVIHEFIRPKNWEQRFMHGISRPYPASLRWRNDQGAWFTPFDRPGATAPYDLRGWHQTKSSKR
jgi:hypothetical protein